MLHLRTKKEKQEKEGSEIEIGTNKCNDTDERRAIERRRQATTTIKMWARC